MRRKAPELDLRSLETYCRVVEERSFTRAAAALYRSQAAVSERIAALERDLGARLLDRLGRETVPTAVGRALYAGARDLLARRAELSRELEGMLGSGGGAVAIGASTTPGEYDLPQLLPRFLERHPGVRLKLSIGDSGDILAAMSAHELELGLVGVASETEGLRMRPLWQDQLLLALPPSHRWASKRKIAAAHLAEEPMLMREEGSGTRGFLESALAAAGIAVEEMNVVAVLGSAAAIKHGVIAGLGISFVSKRALEVESRAGLLAAIGVNGIDLKRRIHLVDSPRRSLPRAASRLRRFLLEAASPAFRRV